MFPAAQLSTAYKEHLHNRFAVVLREGYHVLIGASRAKHTLRFEHALQLSDAVTKHGCALEFQPLASSFHFCAHVLDNLVLLALQEEDHLIYGRVVSGLVGERSTRAEAAMDKVFHARARILTGDFFVAGSERKQFVEQV